MRCSSGPRASSHLHANLAEGPVATRRSDRILIGAFVSYSRAADIEGCTVLILNGSDHSGYSATHSARSPCSLTPLLMPEPAAAGTSSRWIEFPLDHRDGAARSSQRPGEARLQSAWCDDRTRTSPSLRAIARANCAPSRTTSATESRTVHSGASGKRSASRRWSPRSVSTFGKLKSRKDMVPHLSRLIAPPPASAACAAARRAIGTRNGEQET